ncbi:alpha/beta fold hydrolase [Pigmentibacter ruber]|nr:alpha/beta hydrolase [Pigmentibacter ruber]
MPQKNFNFHFLSSNMHINRYLQLKLLQFVVRPAKKVENLEVVKSTEIALDKSFSKILKSALNLTGFSSSVITTKYGQIHYYDSNPKSDLKPIIFVHGLGSSAQSWWILGKMLENKRRIIIPDLFHMAGFSQANNSVMNFLEHAESLIEFISKVTEDTVDLCGLSLGGWLSMYIASTQQKRVNKLILLNPAGLKVNPFGLRDTLSFLSWRKFHKLYPGIMKAFPFTGIPILSKTAKRALYRNLKDEKIKDLLNSTKEDHFVDDNLKNIKCPVLLLWGKEDKLLSCKIPILLNNNIKNITAKWVEDCAHVLSLEAPATCYQEINNFLNLKSIKDNIFTQLVLSSSFSYKTTLILKKERDHDY